MKNTINFETFRDGFQENAGFSFEGLELLFDFLEEMEDGQDTETEFDPVSIMCEYSELTTAEFLNDYSYTFTATEPEEEETEDETEERIEEEIETFLSDHTCFVGKTDRINQFFPKESKKPSFVFSAF